MEGRGEGKGDGEKGIRWMEDNNDTGKVVMSRVKRYPTRRVPIPLRWICVL